MIETIRGLPDHVAGFRVSGVVTGAEYEQVIIPDIEARLKKHAKVRLLYHIGDAFEKFEAAAMWNDAKVGLQHIASWERIAVVSDVGWIAGAVKVFGFAWPGHVRLFANAELDRARDWIAG